MDINDSDFDFGYWNHRVIRHEDKYGDDIEVWYSIHECFYSEKDRDIETAIPHTWTQDAVGFTFYEPKEAAQTLARFQRALDRPWYKIVDEKLVEISNDCETLEI